MKVTRIVLSFSFLLLLPAMATAQKVHVDWDKETNFSGFKTYAWGDNTHVKDQLMDQRITQGIESQLAAKGLQKVDPSGNPDLVVRYHGSTSTETQLNTYGSGGWYWGGGMSTTTVDKIRVGQLIVDIGDSKSKKFIWRGTASETLSDNPQKVEKSLDKALNKMFEKFPPPVKK
jgi:Domain of unknown function (DUF4136)